MHRLIATVLGTALATVLLTPPAAASNTPGVFTSHPVASDTFVPQGLAAGPDGNMWVTMPTKTSILKVTPSGAVTEFQNGLSEASAPWQITAGPDGNMWFTEFLGQRIGRITMEGEVTEYDLSGVPLPWGVTAGPDGNVWVTLPGTNEIAKIDPSDGAVLNSYSAGSASGLRSITAGPDGRLWFATSYGEGPTYVGAITTSGSVSLYPIPTASAGLTGITTGPDGNIWVTESASGKLAKVTPSGNVTEYATTLGRPQSIATGPDGNLWVTDELSAKIARVTTSGTVTYFDTGGVNSYTIAAAPSGDMWFSMPDSFAVGSVTTGLDPSDTAPTLTGTGTINTDLTCADATWGTPPSTTTTSWQRDGQPIAGESGSTYTVGRVDVAQGITCTQTVTIPGVPVPFESVSNSVKGVPLPPGPPEDVVVTPLDGAALVSWQPPADDGGQAPAAYTVTATPGGQQCTTGTLSCTVRGLVNGTAYTFTVIATNSAGPGPDAAPSSQVVPLAVQTITFTSSPPAPSRPGGTYRVRATGGGSGNPVVFALTQDSTACRIADNTVLFLRKGTCVITADQAGDASHAPAAQGTQTVQVRDRIRQKPVAPLDLPRALKNPGLTRVVDLPVRTNAGQNARVRVTGRYLAPSAAGEMRPLQVIRMRGALWVRLGGGQPLNVSVRIRAGAVPGYTAYRMVKTYRTR